MLWIFGVIALLHVEEFIRVLCIIMSWYLDNVVSYEQRHDNPVIGNTIWNYKKSNVFRLFRPAIRLTDIARESWHNFLLRSVAVSPYETKVCETFEIIINNHNRLVCLSVRRSVARQSLESSSVRFQSAVVGCGNTASATRPCCAFPRARACRAVRRVMLLPGACVRVRAVCCGARPV